MSILNLLLMLAAAFALYWQIKRKRVFPIIITVGMIVGMIIVLFLPGTLRLTGFFIYMGFVALAFFYGLTVKGTGIWARMVIILMSAGIFTYWLWVLNHWHGNEILAPLLTLIAGLAAIFSKVRVKNELGFLILLATDAVAILIEHLLKSA
jgi:hypothetical protein